MKPRKYFSLLTVLLGFLIVGILQAQAKQTATKDVKKINPEAIKKISSKLKPGNPIRHEVAGLVPTIRPILADIDTFEGCSSEGRATVTYRPGHGFHQVDMRNIRICHFKQESILIPDAQADVHISPSEDALYPDYSSSGPASPSWVQYWQYPTNAGGVYSQGDECTGYAIITSGTKILLKSQTANMCNTILQSFLNNRTIDLLGYVYFTGISEEGDTWVLGGVVGGTDGPASLIDLEEVHIHR
ncbi:MAG: hypothetical protein Q7T11_06785 [Deltaproteobacteria bacterium]|nr:hypothetical protein [Deltaproteobacteria bacterium]